MVTTALLRLTALPALASRPFVKMAFVLGVSVTMTPGTCQRYAITEAATTSTIVNYKEEECNQHYSEDYARKFVYNADVDHYYFEECQNACHTYEKCSNGEYAPASPPANAEPPKPIYPGKSPVVIVPDVPEQSFKFSKTQQHYSPVNPEHPGTPKQPKTPKSPENTTKPEAPVTISSNKTLEVLVVIAGAAKKTFAGVAAAFASLAFLQ